MPNAKNLSSLPTFVNRRPTTEVHTESHTELRTVATTVHTEPRTVATTVRTSVGTTDHHTELHTESHSNNHTNLPANAPQPTAQGRAGLTGTQVRIFDFLAVNDPCKLSYKDMGAALGISPFTIRDAIYVFRNRGWLHTEKWRNGVRSGVQTTLRIDRLPEGKPVIVQGQPSLPKQTSVGTSEGTSPRISIRNSVGSSVGPPPPLLDRKIENLSISLTAERIALTWPHLARSGFGPAQLAQISQALAELGKPTDKIVQSLDHAEWELENGKMTDKTGAAVTDPCSWIFRSLARTGYYRKPAGYISPEEQALIDAEETAKAILARQQAAQTAHFEAWRATLTPEAFAEAMQGYRGGPKDPWLKNYWLKQQTA